MQMKARKNYIFLLVAVWLSATLLSAEAVPKNQIKVLIKLAGATAKDELKLKVGSATLFAAEYPYRQEYKATFDSGLFRFEIPVTSASGYFSVSKARTFTDTGAGAGTAMIISQQIWRNGDSIFINASVRETYAGINGHYTFQGLGALRYTLNASIDSILFLPTQESSSDLIAKHGIVDPYEVLRPIARAFLDNHKGGLSQQDWEILRIKIDFFNGNSVFVPLKNYWQGLSVTERSNAIKKYQSVYKERFNKQYTASGLLQSLDYLKFIRYRYAAESILVNGRFDFMWIYNSIKSSDQAQSLKDACIAVLFSRYRLPVDANTTLDDAISFVSENDASVILRRIKEATGKKLFTGFELFDINNNVVSYADFKGKTVLLDFWTNGCGGCKLFYETALKYVEEKFAHDSSVVFLSIGADRWRKRWIDGIGTGFYTSNDAINLYTGPKGEAHPVISDNFIKSFPTVILVNKDGYIFKHNTQDLYHKDSLIVLIEKIK
ncbi:thioredoxin-like domain-containing protein [Chitinophaga sp. OAE865]|uniref:TlpA family protein disulfide reductase n=1 Tax=Chitinophaga sp. OAE865 TaxID=2817898 RepID=UPI001AE33D85